MPPLLSRLILPALYLSCAVATAWSQSSLARALPVATPEQVGVDGAKLAKAIEVYAKAAGGAGAERMVVVRQGCVIWRGAMADQVQPVRGLPKVITSLVFGVLVDEGKFALDDPAARYEPRLAELYPTVTFRHFLTNTSGYRGIDDLVPHSELFSKPPLEDPFVPIEPKFPAGTQFELSDTAIVMGVLAATRAAGESFEDVFWSRVGGPIGVDRERFSWGAYALPGGIRVNGGAGHFHGITTNADELAKVAVLLAGDGNWNGRQLVSRRYLQAATEVQADRPKPDPKYVPGGFIFRTLGVHSRLRLDLPDLPIRATWGMASKNTSIAFVPEWSLAVVRLSDGRPEQGIGSEALVTFLSGIGAAIKQP